MIFSAYLYEAPNISGGMDSAISGIFTAVPIFTPMFLLFVFCIVLIGGSTAQQRRTGMTDMPFWASISSLSTLLIALALSVIGGTIQTLTLVVVVLITIISGIWLFLDRNNREV